MGVGSFCGILLGLSNEYFMSRMTISLPAGAFVMAVAACWENLLPDTWYDGRPGILTVKPVTVRGISNSKSG
jgi:hypothetical protein